MQEIEKEKNVLADKLMSRMTLDSPSESFNLKILSKLKEKEESVYRYQPLIRAKTFYIIGLFSLVIMLAILSLNPLSNSSWFDLLHLELFQLSSQKFSMPSFSSSSMMISASVLFLIMFVVQVTSLKHHHDKSLGL